MDSLQFRVLRTGKLRSSRFRQEGKSEKIIKIKIDQKLWEKQGKYIQRRSIIVEQKVNWELWGNNVGNKYHSSSMLFWVYSRVLKAYRMTLIIIIEKLFHQHNQRDDSIESFSKFSSINTHTTLLHPVECAKLAKIYGAKSHGTHSLSQ